jgi:hypothetical protein
MLTGIGGGRPPRNRISGYESERRDRVRVCSHAHHGMGVWRVLAGGRQK